ncbi:hypothetical protein FNF29_02670 [Cafeteria roenbergensis]|uniref:Uncharacterized protein n=1 Tax=Cafeteria roenbergensis TaxID=33653 RepID=A0A5A8CNF9_CAFRO|nr:hypothetical protein FNF29_02670 [Cafeteria roenbergensis]|eukprot:KAA0154047.1 hypothetical protein FNF29_02670 [Cafeteria roenbergensis]
MGPAAAIIGLAALALAAQQALSDGIPRPSRLVAHMLGLVPEPASSGMQRIRQGIERGFAKDPGSLSADECAVVEGYEGKGFSSGVASFCHRSLNLAHSRAAKEAIAGLSSTEASESDTAWTLAMISAVRDLAALPSATTRQRVHALRRSLASAGPAVASMLGPFQRFASHATDAKFRRRLEIAWAAWTAASAATAEQDQSLPMIIARVAAGYDLAQLASCGGDAENAEQAALTAAATAARQALTTGASQWGLAAWVRLAEASLGLPLGVLSRVRPGALQRDVAAMAQQVLRGCSEQPATAMLDAQRNSVDASLDTRLLQEAALFVPAKRGQPARSHVKHRQSAAGRAAGLIAGPPESGGRHIARVPWAAPAADV